MLGTLGHRVRTATLNFASWGPSAGVLLLLATVLAIIITNSPLGPRFEALWKLDLGFTLGGAGFQMSLRHWVDDALLTIFFLVVGLEIKREFTVGHLASRRSAALPVAGAVGGMVVPPALYLLIVPPGAWFLGWGVPMATDTAFAVAVIAMMGSRVPVELRIFLTAAAIVDDIGAIVVVAGFYSGELYLGYVSAMLAIIVGLTLGKPLGLLGASAISIWLGIATKSVAYTWRQLAGAGALPGIGFTMSLFIAGQAFPTESDFAASKIAVFIASVLSAIVGTALLWSASSPTASEEEHAGTAASEAVLGTVLDE